MGKRALIATIVFGFRATGLLGQMHHGGGMDGGGGMGGGMDGGGGGGGGMGGGTTLTTFTTNDFTGSGNCAFCHSSRIDSTGRDVSMDRQWRSTMMANAAQDPLWQAKISSEVSRNPELRAIIEDKCSRCHTPMARVQAVTDNMPVAVLGSGFLSGTHPLHAAAMDGVSCSLCHQIDETGLGTPASFTGNYVIDTSTSSPSRWVYGSFAEPFQNPMQMHVGYTPVQGAHVNDSAYCGSCHTLYTPIVDAGGQIAGEFPEQTPYLEWQNSAFRSGGTTQHCQDCHTPHGPGAVALSNRPRWLPTKQPVGQHTFAGANNFILGMLKAHGSELGVTADTAHFDATTALTTEQLTQHTAGLSIVSQKVEGSVLTAVLEVSNLAGHKFPTGVPIRRAWLHVRVTDRRGRPVFESGNPWPSGRIVGNDADNFPGQFEPHYDVITSADQVQIYEAIMHDSDDQVTYTFLESAGYLKDNRLLPAGFDKAGAGRDIAVYGGAAQDQNFVGGTDRVTYQIDISGARLPVQLTAGLLYQTAGYRFVEDLRQDLSGEVQRFATFYDAADRTPIRIAAVP